MTKFFYFFLLNLLVFSDLRAYSLDPRTLDKIESDIGKLELKEIENSGLVKNSIEDSTLEKKKTDSKRGNAIKPFSFFCPHNFQKYPFPANNIGVVEMTADDRKSFESNEKVFPKTVTRRKNDFELDVCKERLRLRRKKQAKRSKTKNKKEIFSPFWSDKKKSKRYLDYTNSQMPFNEGTARNKNSRTKASKVVEENQPEEKKLFGNEDESKRKERTISKRLLDFKRPLESNFDLLADDAILEISRVRRFLDHERAKKRVRTSSTLEDKEAAMSRVLDPNLNLDGILEPHVRRRRGRFTKKRDLSSRTRHKNRIEIKQFTGLPKEMLLFDGSGFY